MLFLLFELGSDRYALDTAVIAEVLPLVDLKGLPHAPDGVAGLLNYRGRPVPVIDLTLLMLGRRSAARLGTRVILVHVRDARGRQRLLGAIAEQVARTIRREESDVAPSGLMSQGAPYLGSIAVDDGALVQRIDVDALLPPAVRDALFADDVDG